MFRIDEHASVNKLIREQGIVLVVKAGLCFDGAGGGVNLVVEAQQHAFAQFLRVGTVPGLNFQWRPRFLCLYDGRDIVLWQSENQINRMGLCNDDNPGGIAAGYLVTHIHKLQAHPTINRSCYPAPVELQLRAGDAGFIGFYRPLCFVDQRLLCIQLLTRDQIRFDQLLIAGEVATRIG